MQEEQGEPWTPSFLSTSQGLSRAFVENFSNNGSDRDPRQQTKRQNENLMAAGETCSPLLKIWMKWLLPATTLPVVGAAPRDGDDGWIEEGIQQAAALGCLVLYC